MVTDGVGARKRIGIDLLLLLLAVWTLALVARAAMHSADVKADLASVSREARHLHEALTRYREQNGTFPGTTDDTLLDRETLDPLRERGYYEGAVVVKLADRRIDAYVASGAGGPNQEFWLEMTLAREPSIRFLVARSDDAPLGGGRWRDGAFVYRDGTLEPL